MLNAELQYYVSSPYFAESLDEEEASRNGFLSRYDTLPEILKDYLINTQTSDSILEIGAKYGLDEFSCEPVAKIIRDITMGDLFIRDMPLQVSARTGLAPEKSAQLSNEAIKAVPAVALGEIKKIQREKFAATISRLEAQRTEKPVMPSSNPAAELPSNRVTPHGAQTTQPLGRPINQAFVGPERIAGRSSMSSLANQTKDPVRPTIRPPIRERLAPLRPVPAGRPAPQGYVPAYKSAIPKPNAPKGNIIDLRRKNNP